LPQWDILALSDQEFLCILYIVGLYFQFLLSEIFLKYFVIVIVVIIVVVVVVIID